MYTWRRFNAELYQVIVMIEPKTPTRSRVGLPC